LKGALAPEGVVVGRIARRVRQAGVYFVTTDTWQRHDLFINTALANIVVEQIVNCRDRGFYKLYAFVVMPNHLHVLLTPCGATTIEKVMLMIKGGSSHRMGRESPQRFPIWNEGFHDRWLRDAGEYQGTKSYVEQNPVEAKLVQKADEYLFSSASGKYSLDLSRFEEARG
jgi:putative transposase